MKRLPLLFLLLTLGCGESPGPMATDDIDLAALYEKDGSNKKLLTGDIDHVAGPAYFNEAAQAQLWRRRVAEFAVKADGEGVYTYARYAGDAVTIVGTMKVDVMCAGKDGQFAAVAGPIVEGTGIYEGRVGQWYLGYVEDGGTPGVNGDRFRANYEGSLVEHDAANPGRYACEVVDLLTNGNDNSVPAKWVVTRNGDGSLLDRSCSGGEEFYDDTWPAGILDDPEDREKICDTSSGLAAYPVWYTSWPDDPLGLSPAQGGNLRVH